MRGRAGSILFVLGAASCTGESPPDTSAYVEGSRPSTQNIDARSLNVREKLYVDSALRIKRPLGDLRVGATYTFVVEGDSGYAVVLAGPDADVDISAPTRTFAKSSYGQPVTKQVNAATGSFYFLDQAKEGLSQVQGLLTDVTALLGGHSEGQIRETLRNLGIQWVNDPSQEKRFFYTSMGDVDPNQLRPWDISHEVPVTLRADTTLRAIQVYPKPGDGYWRLSETSMDLDLVDFETPEQREEKIQEIVDKRVEEILREREKDQNTNTINQKQQIQPPQQTENWTIPDQVNASYDFSNPEEAILAYIEASNNGDRALLERLRPLKLRIDDTNRYLRTLKETNKVEPRFEIIRRMLSLADPETYIPTFREYVSLGQPFREIDAEVYRINNKGRAYKQSREGERELRELVRSKMPLNLIPGTFLLWKTGLGSLPPYIVVLPEISFGLPEGFETHYSAVVNESAGLFQLFGSPGRVGSDVDRPPQPPVEKVLDIVDFAAQYYSRDPRFYISDHHGNFSNSGQLPRIPRFSIQGPATPTDLESFSTPFAPLETSGFNVRLEIDPQGRMREQIERSSPEDLRRGNMSIENGDILWDVPFIVGREGPHTSVLAGR